MRYDTVCRKMNCHPVNRWPALAVRYPCVKITSTPVLTVPLAHRPSRMGEPMFARSAKQSSRSGVSVSQPLLRNSSRSFEKLLKTFQGEQQRGMDAEPDRERGHGRRPPRTPRSGVGSNGRLHSHNAERHSNEPYARTTILRTAPARPHYPPIFLIVFNLKPDTWD